MCDIERDETGRHNVCGRCARADVARGFCRVTARCIRPNTPSGACPFFHVIPDATAEKRNGEKGCS